EKLGMDPVELRILNDAKSDPISGKPFSSRYLVRCLQRGAERFEWSRAYPAYITPAVARIRMHADGKVDLSVGAHEMGQGIRSAIAAVAAEELGVPPGRLRLLIGDTIVPPQHVTSGATGAATISIPIAKASLRLRHTLAELAVKGGRATFAGVDPALTRLRGGRLHLPNGETASVADILAAGRVHAVGCRLRPRAQSANGRKPAAGRPRVGNRLGPDRSERGRSALRRILEQQYRRVSDSCECGRAVFGG